MKIIAVSLLLIMLLTGVSCGSETREASPAVIETPTDGLDSLEAGNSEQIAVSSSNMSEKIAELAEKYRDDPARFDAAVYALSEGIEVDEAVNRFEIMDKAGVYGAELEKNESATLAGFWMEHQPRFRLVAAFTENGEETLEKYREKYPDLVAITEVVELKYTQAELLAAQQEANRILNELGLFFSSATMIMTNRVEIYVTDSQLFYSRLEESGKTLPECVVPVIIYEPMEGVPEGLNPDPLVHFPQLKTASGTYMLAELTGELELVDGYLRVSGNLIIWQPGFFIHNNNGTIEIWDKDGKVVGRVGEVIDIGGGQINSTSYDDRYLKESLPEDAEGPFWIQGDGPRIITGNWPDLCNIMTVYAEKQPYYFIQKKAPLKEFTGVGTKVTFIGRLAVDNEESGKSHCISLYISQDQGNVKQYILIWPEYYWIQEEHGILEIWDAAGDTVAHVTRDGEEINIEGYIIDEINIELFRRISEELPEECSNPYFLVNRVVE